MLNPDDEYIINLHGNIEYVVLPRLFGLIKTFKNIETIGFTDINIFTIHRFSDFIIHISSIANGISFYYCDIDENIMNNLEYANIKYFTINNIYAIRPYIVKIFMNSLKKWNIITKLDLSVIDIQDSIIDLIYNNTSLKDIRIYLPFIQEEFKINIIDAIKTHPNLQDIFLECSLLSDTLNTKLSDLLKYNRTLRNIHIQFRQLAVDDFDKLLDYSRNNCYIHRFNVEEHAHGRFEPTVMSQNYYNLEKIRSLLTDLPQEYTYLLDTSGSFINNNVIHRTVYALRRGASPWTQQ